MLKYLSGVVVTVLVMTCTNAVGESQFKITTRRDNDKVGWATRKTPH